MHKYQLGPNLGSVMHVGCIKGDDRPD